MVSIFRKIVYCDLAIILLLNVRLNSKQFGSYDRKRVKNGKFFVIFQFLSMKT